MAAVDAELMELRQKAKAVEMSRAKAAKNEEAQKLIAIQRAQIDKLKQENRQLQQDLSEDLKGTGSTSFSQQDRVDKLHELADTYTRKIEMESRQLESIQQELELNQAKVHKLRKSMGGSNAPDDNKRQAAKHRLVLENRLEQAERRFGETLAKNREMRAEIESMNKQREAFEQVQTRLERELQAKRVDVASLRQLAAVANEARMLAVSQLESLKTQSDREQASFEMELSELSRCLHGDKQLLEAQAQRLERLLVTPEVEGDQVQEDSDGPTFQEAVETLAKAVDMDSTNLQALVAHFSGLEAANFKTFNEISASNECIAAMQNQIRTLENDARQAEVEGVLGKQKEVIRQTLTKRDQALRRAEMLEEKRVAMERRLASVRSGVSQVLQTLGCAPAAVKQQDAGGPVVGGVAVGGKAGDQPSALQEQAAALAQSLSQLEARSRAIVAVWSMVMGKTAAVPGARAMLQSQMTVTSRDAAAAAAVAAGKGARGHDLTEAPVAAARKYGNKLFDDSGSEGSDEEDEAPLTRDQIQERLAGGQVKGDWPLVTGDSMSSRN